MLSEANVGCSADGEASTLRSDAATADETGAADGTRAAPAPGDGAGAGEEWPGVGTAVDVVATGAASAGRETSDAAGFGDFALPNDAIAQMPTGTSRSG